MHEDMMSQWELRQLLALLFRPDSWLVLLAASAFLASLLERRRLGRVLTALTVSALLALTILPLGDVLLRPFEAKYPPGPDLDRVDGIVLLGGGEDVMASGFWDQPQFNEGADRHLAALELAQRHPGARLLVTGGNGWRGREELTEAGLAIQFFRRQGLSEERLLLEDRSRNTVENAIHSYRLARPQDEEVWVLVTSAFHVERALQAFQSAGWNSIVAWPTDFRSRAFRDGIGWNLARNLAVLNIAVKEWVGSVAQGLLAPSK